MRTQRFNVRPGTPQSKIVEVSDKFGQKNIIKQQGTSRIIYDSLPLAAGVVTYDFFKEANGRVFPFTNMNRGNKLEAAETLAVQFAHFSILKKVEKAATPTTYDIRPVGLTNPDATIALGEISFFHANTQVMKPIRVLNFNNSFNRMPNSLGEQYKFHTNLIILPMTEFWFTVRIFAYTPPIPEAGQTITEYLFFTVEGTGSIMAPKDTM